MTFKVKDGINVNGSSFVNDERDIFVRNVESTGTVAVADVNVTGKITGPATFVIDPASVGDDTGVVVIKGDLQVDGSTTTVNSSELVVTDASITLGQTSTPMDVIADGGGIILKGDTDKTFTWELASNSWVSSENVGVRAGRSFRVDGVSVLNDTTLGSTVTTSSLTTVGTLESLTVSGDVVFSGTGAIKLPEGTDAEQPANATGLVRFNTTSNSFEGNNGSGWSPFAIGVNGVTIADDDASSTSHYLTLTSATSGNAAGLTVTSTKLSFTPSTGVLSATSFSGAGSLITDLNASALTQGTVPGERGTLSGSTNTSFVKYAGVTPEAGAFDGSTTAPVATTRLNYNGHLYATLFAGSGANLTALNATNITTGTVSPARLGSGIADSSTYLRGDGTWVAVANGVSITDDTATNASFYPVFNAAASGTMASAKVSSTKLYFNPNTGVLNSTSFNSLSDASLKTNVQTVSSAGALVDQLRGVSFDWIDGSGASYGVIAQELEQVLPELVATGEHKTVNYSGIIAVLIEAVKELRSEVESLKAK